MSSTYSTLKFELIATGEQSGLWGATTDVNIGTAIQQAIVGMATLTSADFTANTAALTAIDTNSAQNFRALCLNIAASAVSAAGTITVPAIQKPYIVINGSSYDITVKVSGQTGVVVPTGKRSVVYNNGTDVGQQIDFLTGLTLGTALAVTSGGTGSTTAGGARTNLGVPANDGTGATGTWNISISGAAASATTATTATTATNATNLATANFTITQSGSKLYIKYGSTNLMSIDSSGNIIGLANVTAYGTP
jgi:hypothetical protein